VKRLVGAPQVVVVALALPKEEAYPRSWQRFVYLCSELLEWLMER
jgi:hypothetical protein